ncbi:MAG: alpha/beta hydrolase [Acidimicrobiales bacterium]
MGGARASTVLFVHGAHLAGWCWLLVMDQLARLGIESHAVDLPLTGYADDVESVRAAVDTARSRWGAVHVVCHSYAGLPVAEAGHAAAHLTFVAGRLPLAGESQAAETPRWQFPEFQACMRPGDDGVVRLSPAARRFFFHRTPIALADYAMCRLRPMSSTVPSAPFADPAWTSVPSSYVVCADDRAVRPEAQRERAAIVGTSVELDTDHSPFFSGAPALADFIADRHRAMARP